MGISGYDRGRRNWMSCINDHIAARHVGSICVRRI